MYPIVGCRLFRMVFFSCLMLACSWNLYGREVDWLAEHEPHTGNSGDPWGEFEITRKRYIFSGLASYYNNVRFYIVGKEIFQELNPDETVVLKNDMWLAVVGRFEVLLVRSPNLRFPLHEWEDSLEILRERVEPDDVRIVRKSDLYSIAPEFDQLRYAHLWMPLSWLAIFVEYSLTAIHAYGVADWGLAIVALSILLTLALYPVHVAVARMQNEVSRIRSLVEPQLAEIKEKYEGEEAHHRVVAAYEGLGVTPFYSLRPVLGVLIQIPIWIGVFNSLGEMPQLEGQSFLWIEDLAYPDGIVEVPLGVPLFGGAVHLLPFLMTGVACLSAWTLRNSLWSAREFARRRRNHYGLAIIFLLIFYPFPAAMVLYWTLNILWQIVTRLVVRES